MRVPGAEGCQITDRVQRRVDIEIVVGLADCVQHGRQRDVVRFDIGGGRIVGVENGDLSFKLRIAGAGADIVDIEIARDGVEPHIAVGDGAHSARGQIDLDQVIVRRAVGSLADIAAIGGEHDAIGADFLKIMIEAVNDGACDRLQIDAAGLREQGFDGEIAGVLLDMDAVAGPCGQRRLRRIVEIDNQGTDRGSDPLLTGFKDEISTRDMHRPCNSAFDLAG